MSENRFGFAYNSLGEIEVKSLVGEIQHVLVQDTDGNAGRVLPATLVSAATRGDDGDSAYTIAVAEGFSGTQTEWIASLAGSRGSQGVSGTITVGTVTTGSADTSAIISNSGTLTNAVFDFQIPRGNTGAAGPQGTQGIQGIQGDTGPKGSKGDTGDTGSQGIQGLQGITGPQGNNGTNGTSGTDGTDGDGWTGGTYSVSTGIVTFASDDGLGFTTGDLRGATGPIGNNGPQGDAGVKGDTGDTGATGDTGDTGPQGDAGADGADGADGLGVPAGGTAGQVLEKIDGTDYNTQWATVSGGGAVDSVNGATGVVVLDADDIDDAATVNKFVTAADITKLSNLSGTNTGDQDLSGLQPLATVLTNTTASFTTALSGNIATNNAKVTNATHTGDVTGSTALTISAGAVDIAMLSATGTASSSTYLRGDNTWASVSGSGDVSKVGTPVNNQVGVWTGDGTIEGTSGFTWDGSNLAINGTVNLAGNSETAVFGDDTYVTKYVTIRDGAFYAVRWGLQASTNISSSGACLMSSSKPIAFKANTSTAFDSLTTFDFMIDTSGNILVSGTVDGRNVATDGTKLDGIEALADVTDTANVTAAGALMDSEVDADIKTLSLPASTTISTFGASLVDDASASAARTTLGVDLFIESDVTGVSGADAVTNIISLTQAEYDAITPNVTTLYLITDAV